MNFINLEFDVEIRHCPDSLINYIGIDLHDFLAREERCL
jgi:hypothetical protein